MEGNLDVRGASFRVSEVFALTGLSFALRPGRTGLLGINGAGKSTLMRLLAGAQRPSDGRVSINGLDMYGRHRPEALAKVAFMPQSAQFPRNLSALEIVSLLGWSRGLSAKDAKARAERVLDDVGLHERAGDKIARLSGGMQRRVALAQALVTNPQVLLLDEPSTGLDPQQRRLMVDLLRGLDGTVLMSSHIIEDVCEVADRVIVLHEGSIRFDGPTMDLADLGRARLDPSASASDAVEAGFLHLVSRAAMA